MDTTQFTKSQLLAHGELEYGTIPTALKYARPFQVTQLSNGVRVASEYHPGALATVGVHIGAGTRNEDFEKAGITWLSKTIQVEGD